MARFSKGDERTLKKVYFFSHLKGLFLAERNPCCHFTVFQYFIGNTKKNRTVIVIYHQKIEHIYTHTHITIHLNNPNTKSQEHC